MSSFSQKCLSLLLVVFFSLFVNSLYGQNNFRSQQKTFYYGIELQGSAGTDTYLPFWLYANKHGAVDINAPGSSAIFNFHKRLMNDRSGFDYGFGATFVSRLSANKTFFFNRLYGAISYGAFQLKGGRFYEILGTVDESLSMGSLAISSNATPLPKIKFGIPEYTDIPLTQGLVEIKGEIAHGWFEQNRFVENPWLHQKAAYLRFGGDFAFRPYIGLTNQVTWAGTAEIKGDLPDSFRDFLLVLTAQSGEDGIAPGEEAYRLGDHRGIWDLGFYLTLADINFTLYRHQIYNDKDGLKFQTPDGLTGLSVALPDDNHPFISGFLWEFLYTKDQSGPIPPEGNRRDGAGGRDNYYNNYLYKTGWTYYGRTIGNPLFLNAYNPQLQVVAAFERDPENPYGIANNRIVAHHFGVEGYLSEVINYKLLATWSRNYGNYYDGDLFEEEGLRSDFLSNPEQWSFLAEFSYRPFSLQYVQLNASFAADVGELYAHRFGIMVGIELLGTSPF